MADADLGSLIYRVVVDFGEAEKQLASFESRHGGVAGGGGGAPLGGGRPAPARARAGETAIPATGLATPTMAPAASAVAGAVPVMANAASFGAAPAVVAAAGGGANTMTFGGGAFMPMPGVGLARGLPAAPRPMMAPNVGRFGGRGGFFGPPNGVGLLMSFMFGGWELAQANQAVSDANFQMMLTNDPAERLQLQAGGLRAATGGPLGSIAGWALGTQGRIRDLELASYMTRSQREMDAQAITLRGDARVRGVTGYSPSSDIQRDIERRRTQAESEMLPLREQHGDLTERLGKARVVARMGATTMNQSSMYGMPADPRGSGFGADYQLGLEYELQGGIRSIKQMEMASVGARIANIEANRDADIRRLEYEKSRAIGAEKAARLSAAGAANSAALGAMGFGYGSGLTALRASVDADIESAPAELRDDIERSGRMRIWAYRFGGARDSLLKQGAYRDQMSILSAMMRRDTLGSIKAQNDAEMNKFMREFDWSQNSAFTNFLMGSAAVGAEGAKRIRDYRDNVQLQMEALSGAKDAASQAAQGKFGLARVMGMFNNRDVEAKALELRGEGDLARKTRELAGEELKVFRREILMGSSYRVGSLNEMNTTAIGASTDNVADILRYIATVLERIEGNVGNAR